MRVSYLTPPPPSCCPQPFYPPPPPPSRCPQPLPPSPALTVDIMDVEEAAAADVLHAQDLGQRLGEGHEGEGGGGRYVWEGVRWGGGVSPTFPG